MRHFISGLTDVRAFDEAAALIKLVRERGNRLRKPRSAPLGGGLFELRGEQVRIFSVFRPGHCIVFLDGMVKKRNDIPHDVLERVRQLLKEVR